MNPRRRPLFFRTRPVSNIFHGFVAAALWLAIVALLFAPDSLRAAGGLSATVLPLSPRGRTDAPRPVEVRLHWNGSQLLEGRIELTLKTKYESIVRVQGPETALTNGDQSFRMFLPPVSRFEDTAEVAVRFLAKSETLDAGSSPIFVPESSGRNFLVCLCKSAAESSDGSIRLWDHLRPLSYIDALPTLWRSAFKFSPAHFSAEDMPDDPLAYCAFDVVVVDETAFGELHEKQLAALARWIRAGGSACIFPGSDSGNRLPGMLTQLLGESRTKARAAASSGVKEIQSYTAGLGQLVLAPPDVDFDSDAWRETLGALWRIRANLRAGGEEADWNVSNSTGTSRNPQRTMAYRNGWTNTLINSKPTTWQFTQSGYWQGGILIQPLLPTEIRLIPTSVIVVILMLFVAMVGPIDYFLLGAFRRRRYTWLLFPCVSAIFTIATVKISRHYLGTRDILGSLRVVDLDEDGRIARVSRVQLFFAAEDREMTTNAQHALASPINGFGFSAAQQNSPPCYVGVMPAQFQIVSRVHQWSPQMMRFLSFDEATPPLPIHLDQNPPWSFDEAVALAKKYALGNTPDDDVYFYQKGQFEQQEGKHATHIPNLLWAISAAGNYGAFTLVSRISPCGGVFKDDLPLIDSNDPNAWFIAVVHYDKDGITIIRRLCHGK